MRSYVSYSSISIQFHDSLSVSLEMPVFVFRSVALYGALHFLCVHFALDAYVFKQGGRS